MKITLALGLCLFFINHVKANECMNGIHLNKSKQNKISLHQPLSTIKHIDTSYLGFNLNSVRFSELIFDKSNKFDNNIIRYLKPFVGAYYRYPGGSLSNYFYWYDSIGIQKKNQKLLGWKKPMPVKFGINEYLKFLNEVNGKLWYVLNMYGDFYGEFTINQLVSEERALSYYLNKNYAGDIYWELGNELDRGHYNWSEEKITIRANKLTDSVDSKFKNNQFVVPMKDYHKPFSIKSSRYNANIINLINKRVNNISFHLYYDGKPGGPSVKNRLNHICATMAEIYKDNNTKELSVWITEHSRMPVGKINSMIWKKNWNMSWNLGAAISISDFIISTMNIKEIKGAFFHVLGASDGPWRLFHKDKLSGEIYPSSVYWALRVLSTAKTGDVYKIQSETNFNASHYGKYAVRSALIKNSDSEISLIVVNRKFLDEEISIKLPWMPSKYKVKINQSYISGGSENIENTDLNTRKISMKKRRFTKTTTLKGELKLNLEAGSVSVFNISKTE